MDKTAKKTNALHFLSEYYLFVLLLVLFLVMSCIKPSLFLTTTFAVNVLITISIYGIMMCGTIMVILSGGIDLSISSVAALSGCVTVKYIIGHGTTVGSVITGIVLSLIIAALIGLLHGLLVVYTGIKPMIITLSSTTIISAAAQMYTNSVVIPLKQPFFWRLIGNERVLGLPTPIYIFAVFIVVAYFILEHTTYGRQLRSVGGNPTASKFAGINTPKVLILAYVASAVMSGLSGIVLASQNLQAVYTAASSYMQNVIVSLMIGGVIVEGGGKGKITGAVIGTLLIGVLTRSMILLGIDSIYHDIIKGGLILVVITVDKLKRR